MLYRCGGRDSSATTPAPSCWAIISTRPRGELDEGRLICAGMADGTEKWRRKDVGAGGLTAADGKLLVLGRDGQLILAEASPAAYNELSRVQPFAAGTATPTKARAG